ncbi:uncharacterized protein LOC114958328 [Acropora millepora]|uniref:uncharacterized protein LOC114958328 n=1 Tax=Acropora millepora TaxID=45264 RepID=UPI001CF0F5B2|nr:uncharacterized protein LOC114958328 [Acropora millepora]
MFERCLFLVRFLFQAVIHFSLESFLNHGRIPEVNISHVTTVISPRFSTLSSLLVKICFTIKTWYCDDKLNTEKANFRLPAYLLVFVECESLLGGWVKCIALLFTSHDLNHCSTIDTESESVLCYLYLSQKFSAGVDLLLVFIIILLCAIIFYFFVYKIDAYIGKCWDAWSRCTRWSFFATGIGWQSCQDRCFCLGHRTGTRVKVSSQCPFTKTPWQCQCSGSSGGAKKPRWCGF